MPAEAPKVDPTTADLHALGRQTTALLDEAGTARSKRETTIRTQHTMPRQGETPVGLSQYATNQTCPSWQSGPRCDLAVAGNATSGNRLDHLTDLGVRAIERDFH